MISKPFARLRVAAAAAMALALWGPMQNAAAEVDAADIAARAPQTYVVVKGDTLWGISGKFLKSPWMWPQLWSQNKSAVKNANRIYPGDVLELSIVNGKASLRAQARSGVAGDIRLKPGVRLEDAVNDHEAVSTISLDSVANFLTRPMLVELEDLAHAPRVLAADSGRLFAGAGSKLYGVGLPTGASGQFSVYRQGTPLVDPDSKDTLAYEAIQLGIVHVVRAGETTLLEVDSSSQEITKGDRLMPVLPQPKLDKPVQGAPADLAARIIKVYDGKSSSLLSEAGMAARPFDREGGPLSVVVLNKGASQGLVEGHVVKLMSRGQTIGRAGTFGYINGEKVTDPVKLPDENNGEAIIFKVFDKVSYALVVKADRQVVSGDGVGAP